jgi:hypothetical protein
MTRDQRFHAWLQEVPYKDFLQTCVELADWDYVVAKFGAEICEDFNNDAIDVLRAQWDLENPETEDDGDS